MRSSHRLAGQTFRSPLRAAAYGTCGPCRRGRWSARVAVPARTPSLVSLAGTALTTAAVSMSHIAPGPTAHVNEPVADLYDVDRHIEAATALLQQTFGPQARITLNVLRQRHQHTPQTNAPCEGATSSSEDSSPMASPSTYCRASATFRLLAFPVELAAVKSTQPDEAIESCLRQALSSDVEFLLPQRRSHGNQPQKQGRQEVNARASLGASSLATLLPELRDLCIFFSRSVKFSIKPPLSSLGGSSQASAGSAEEHAHAWRCRAYAHDDWDTVRHSTLIEAHVGESPRAALLACASALVDRYHKEKDSPAVSLAGVRELDHVLSASQRKRVTVARSDLAQAQVSGGSDRRHTGDANGARRLPLGEGSGGAPAPAWTSTVCTEDAHGNTRTVQLRRQPSSLIGLHTAAMLAIKSEACWDASAHLYDERLPTVPLLVRLRWQFACMVQHLSDVLGKPAASIASVEVGPIGASSGGGASEAQPDEDNSANPTTAPAAVTHAGFTPPHLYRATLTCEDAVVWQATSGGRYRIELDAYAQALLILLDQYGCCVPSLRQQPGLLYPCAALLELALTRHDQMNIVAQHRGNWTGYAVLGTVTSQLLGCYYQTHYRFDPASKYWKATLVVQDGRETEQILIERLSLQKGEAWRHACLDALRENFPVQYAAAVAAHPDMDLSTELMSRGGRFRALPRQKRVRHLGTLFDLVAAFAEEDFGWRQLRVRLRSVSLGFGVPQWVAEMEAIVDPQRAAAHGRVDSTSAPPQRVIVGESPAYTQVKMARRVLVYRLAAQYFPSELATYKALGRPDGVDPEETVAAAVARTQLYNPAKGSVVSQLFALWEAQHPEMAPFTWQLVGDEPVATSTSTDAVASLARVATRLRPACHVQVYSKNGEVLVKDAGRDGLTFGDVAPHDTGLSSTPNVVTSLLAALRHATTQLQIKHGERFWREYETHVFPPLPTARDLCLYLFGTFLGSSDTAAAASQDGVWVVPTAERTDTGSTGSTAGLLDAEAVLLGDYWFATLTLPRVRHVPIARAVHSTKRGAIRDAVILATRNGFGAQLEYLAAHSIALSALASEILLEPVVEVLPDAVLRDLSSDLQQQQRRRAASQEANVPRASQLHQLVNRVQTEYNGSRRLRVQRSVVESSSGTEDGSVEHQCRIYLDPVMAGSTSPHASVAPRVVRGQTQLVGVAVASRESEALELACAKAFGQLFVE